MEQVVPEQTLIFNDSQLLRRLDCLYTQVLILGFKVLYIRLAQIQDYEIPCCSVVSFPEPF